MAEILNKPRGVVYTGNNSVEYQLFPESYFSGADVKVYMGDVFVDDILGISFILQENVKPLYSYSSYTFKEVSRGSRIVQGKFYIAFREAGYLHGILDHIAQFNDPKQNHTKNTAYNDLVSAMYGGDILTFRARALQTFDGLLSEHVNGAINKMMPPEENLPDNYNDLSDSEKQEANARVNKYKQEVASLNAQRQRGVNKYYTSFEKEIWGRDFSSDPSQSDITYFYRTRGNYTKTDGTPLGNVAEYLKKTGFDIYITYGPMEASLTTGFEGGDTNKRVLDKSIPDISNKGFSFNTTVKAIRGIQLMTSEQEILPDGQVVEVISFMASDLD